MTLALPSTRPAQIAVSPATLAVAVFTACGLAIRLAISGGPLGVDEVWSLDNLRPLTNVGGVLWGISHDNNHFLNSLWLYFIWPLRHDPRLARALSILAGTALIPVMAALGARRGIFAALAAAALATFSFFEVTYSVEARGYETATLGLALAFLALERALDEPRSKARFAFAAAAGFAVFSHLASAPAIALMLAAGFAEIFRRRGLRSALTETFALGWPAALAIAPTAAFLVAGYINKGGFTVGFHRDFAVTHVIAAVVNLEMTTFGLDPASRVQAMFAMFVLPPALIAAIALVARPERRFCYAVLLIATPILVIALSIPNTHAPRYYFAAAPFLLLLFSEIADAAWRGGAVAGGLGALALVASLAGDDAALAKLGAGLGAPWTEALKIVAASPDPRLASSYDFNVARSVGHFDRYGSSPVELVARARLCEARPLWYVVELDGDAHETPALALGYGTCTLHYRLAGAFNRDVPWQAAWALYRRDDAGR